MLELAVATFEAELDGALELGPKALLLAEASGRPVLACAALDAEALVLGALQRESSLRARSPAGFDGRVVRRASTGTEAQLRGPALYQALALPRVDSLFPDASARTLLNRNLRALLRGFAAAGVPLRYFGTEVLALLGQPVALVGYDQLASGAVLIEVWIGLAEPAVVRSALRREPPASLWSVLKSRPAPLQLLTDVVAGVAERLGAERRDVSAELGAAPSPAPPVAPAEGGGVSSIAVPVGVVEACLQPTVWLGGDLLVSRAGLRAVELGAAAVLGAGQPLTPELLQPLAGLPLDGARPADLLAALQAAVSSRF